MPSFRRLPAPLTALALALALAATRATALPDDYKVNVREGCRQLVSGAYLNAYTERERGRTLMKTLAGNLQDTEQALTAARAELARLKAKAASHEFELQNAVLIDQANARVNTLAAQKADYEALRAKGKAQLADAEAEEKALLATLSKVFVVERTHDKADGGFPLRLDYKAACPKYRALCPLPVDDARALTEIPLKGGTPETCRRYATQSKLR